MTGLTPRAGQIVHVLPTKSAMLRIRGRSTGKMSSGKVNGNGHTNGNAVKVDGARMNEGIGKFILDRCPSLRGTFTPSWWIRG
jgi:hypothetical protein